MTENEIIFELKEKVEELERIANNFFDVPRSESRKVNKEIDILNLFIIFLDEIKKHRMSDNVNKLIDTGEEFDLILSDLKKYRDIGTIEELQENNEMLKETLSDWRKYTKVGTLEKCRQAVERSNFKSPEYTSEMIFVCPECGEKLLKDYDFCKRCGQAIDWDII